MKSKIERLNWLIREEINREKKKFENLELIEMESANDSLYYENLSSRRERKEKGSITERREEVG